MGKYFTIEELTKSNTAKRNGIENKPTEEQIGYMNALIDNVLDPLREAYGKPIYVNSGFRSKELNSFVGGTSSSHHLCKNGYAAADLTTKTKKGNKEIFELVQTLDLPFAEMGSEQKYAWIHISYNPNDDRGEIFYT